MNLREAFMKLGISVSTFPWPAEEIGPEVSRIATAYRHPGVLVKAVTTLDVMTGGRAIELLQIAHQMWDEARFDAVAAIRPDIHAIEPERG
jgi:hypothetical protein